MHTIRQAKKKLSVSEPRGHSQTNRYTTLRQNAIKRIYRENIDGLPYRISGLNVMFFLENKGYKTPINGVGKIRMVLAPNGEKFIVENMKLRPPKPGELQQ